MNSKQQQYDSVRAMDSDDDEQAVAAADFLLAEFEPDDANEKLQRAILEGLQALKGCEAFDIEELPALDVGNFEEWVMGLELPQVTSPPELRWPHHLPMTPPGTPSPALSPPSTSPPTLMLYAGDEKYYQVPADHVQWEAPVAEEDLEVIEVVEDETTPELVIVTNDDDDEDVQIVCEVTYRPHKRSRDKSPSPPPRRRIQRRNST